MYRTLCAAGLNKVPQQKRDKAKKFKAYEPGYLHVDISYLLKLDGVKQYLFVAINRAIRLLFYWIYDAKTANNTKDCMGWKCLCNKQSGYFYSLPGGNRQHKRQKIPLLAMIFAAKQSKNSCQKLLVGRKHK